jgi:tetratricopeptide (TPR) repeat protein
MVRGYRLGFRALGSAVLIVAIGLSAVACGQFGNLKAKKHFKDGNGLYQQADYRNAAAEYEQAIASDPDMTDVYFYLGNCYDNLYKPARKGEAENDAYLAKAVKNYEISAQRVTEPAKKKLSLQYLAASYGSDKLNDASKAEPIIKQMIDMDPKDTSSYFGLAKIFEDAGRFEDAERVLLQAKAAAPNSADPLNQLANFYSKRGEFDKAVAVHEEHAKLEPNNPQVYWMISAFFYEKVSKDYTVAPKAKADYIQRGLAAADKAIQIKSDFMEAITYKNLLLRQEALIEKDPAKQKLLIQQADELLQRAKELQKLKQKGVGA